MEDKIVEKQGLFPLTQYNFMLRVEGIYDLPCKCIHSFQKENEYEYIQEGGCNNYVHIRRKPISKPFTFQVDRYIGMDYFDPLPNGAELIWPIILFVSRIQNDFENPKITFTFTGCFVTGKSYGELNAEKSGLFVETTTIAYREMVFFQNPKCDGRERKGQNARTLADYGIRPVKQNKRKWPVQSAKHIQDFLGKG